MSWALRFLGVGGAQAVELGSSAVVLEHHDAPLLLVDCGAEALTAYLARYGRTPAAVYITHAHYDHIAGLERLFFRAWFEDGLRGRLRLYCHAALVPWLQARVADYPGVLAEGGVNYWDAFQLVPCQRGFWHAGQWFDVFPTRHHAPNTSFGLALRESFVFTGDTRPIPETLATVAGARALVAHDCALRGNPSHTGLDDLEREYPAALRARMVLYHYGSLADGAQLAAAGYRVAHPGEGFALGPPELPLAEGDLLPGAEVDA
jgi:ribonuclease BN (tRNA processing enzyme)